MGTILLGNAFLIDFRSIFAPNFHPSFCINRAPAKARARFSKKSLFTTDINFSSIWVPNWLHDGFIFILLGRLGGSWGCLGRVLEALGGVLAAKCQQEGRGSVFWDPLGLGFGRFWAVFGWSWGGLGTSFRVLEAS